MRTILFYYVRVWKVYRKWWIYVLSLGWIIVWHIMQRKQKCMTFELKPVMPEIYPIILEGKVLEWTTSVKHVGNYIRNDLSESEVKWGKSCVWLFLKDLLKCIIENVMQLQSSLTCRDMVKENVVIQTVKVIPSSNIRPRWWTMEVGVDSPEWKRGCWIPPKRDVLLLCQRFLF